MCGNHHSPSLGKNQNETIAGLGNDIKESIVDRIIVNEGSKLEEEKRVVTAIEFQNVFHALSSDGS